MDDLLRQARMVVLGFYVSDLRVKRKAGEIIDRHVSNMLRASGGIMNEHEARTRSVEAYYDNGTRYFKRYSAMNWQTFLSDRSRALFDNIHNELESLDQLIAEANQLTKKKLTKQQMSELGYYFIRKVRLESRLESLESDMANLVEAPIFRDKMLPYVVRSFFESYTAHENAR